MTELRKEEGKIWVSDCSSRSYTGERTRMDRRNVPLRKIAAASSSSSVLMPANAQFDTRLSLSLSLLQLKQMIFVDNSRAADIVGSGGDRIVSLPSFQVEEAMEAEKGGVRGCVVTVLRIFAGFLRKCASCLLR